MTARELVLTAAEALAAYGQPLETNDAEQVQFVLNMTGLSPQDLASALYALAADGTIVEVAAGVFEISAREGA